MPELPDLKVYSENINKLILDKKVVDVVIYSKKNVDNELDTIINGIKGTCVSDVTAEGKELFVSFGSGNKLGLNLMLNGKIFYVHREEVASTANKIMGIFFDDGNSLQIADFQSFCKIRYNPPESDIPEVLALEFNLDYFRKMTEKYKRKKIKAFLLDQKIMRGIGNAYADEILWTAKISPKSVTGKIPQGNLDILFVTIKSTMIWAIAQIKKVNPEMINGEERRFMQVHNYRRKFTKDRERIHIETISSKKTYYTDSQVHYY